MMNVWGAHFCVKTGSTVSTHQDLTNVEVRPVATYTSLRARRVHVRFIRVLGGGKRVFKDSVRLIARFYSRSEYDKPLEC